MTLPVVSGTSPSLCLINDRRDSLPRRAGPRHPADSASMADYLVAPPRELGMTNLSRCGQR